LLLDGQQFKKVLAGSCDKFLDIQFDHFSFFLFASVLLFYASHFREQAVRRLWAQRCVVVTGIDRL